MCSWAGSLKTLRQRSAAQFVFIDESQQSMEYTSRRARRRILLQKERSNLSGNPGLVIECSNTG